MSWFAAAALMAAALASTSAGAIELRKGMGGAEGYGENFLNRNDDGSTPAINLPFSVNFFGETYNQVFVNNNGNVTFSFADGSFTPEPFPQTGAPRIAPFWGDVDTRCSDCGLVYYAGDAMAGQFTATWSNVGYYNQNSDLLNDFQLTLLDRSDTGMGNFDIEFRYNQLQWTTGDASDGTNGLGGTPALAGYDAGNNLDFFSLPGSFTGDVLELANTSNVAADTPGLWYFNIRNGGTADGSSPETPLLPTIVNPDGGFDFDFMVDPGELIFIDPFIATGYDYVVNSGPNILSALFPVLPGQSDPYQLFSLDGLTSLGSVAGGTTFNFASGGVNGFQLRGIDVDAMLDPGNPTAFVTGLTFNVTTGNTLVDLTQTPVTTFVPDAVPEPATWAMMILGFGGIGAVIRRRRTAVAYA